MAPNRELILYLVENFDAGDLAERLVDAASPDQLAKLHAEMKEWNERTIEH